jgi:hypothetical protein
VTRFDDILYVDKNHEILSSEPAIAIGDMPDDLDTPNFIAMDLQEPDVRRRTATPVVSPSTLAREFAKETRLLLVCLR